MSEPILHLDLTEFTRGGEAERRDFAQRLLTGLKRHGFITLSGHGVAPELIAESYQSSADFFALPEAEKREYAGGLRGYTPFGVEHAKGVDLPDLKEFWQIGHEAGDAMTSEHPNVWPDRPEGFRDTFQALFDGLYATGLSLLEAIATGLELEPDYFETRVAGGTSLLRLLHYPPVPEGVEPGCVRAAAHEDINLITLLVAAQGAGLELLDRDGAWLPVENAPDHLIVDTGDMMARLTRGVLPATTHRVVNPAGPNVSRYSIPFFVQPRSDVVLEGLESCRSESGEDAPPIPVGDFLNQRLKDIGLPGA